MKQLAKARLVRNFSRFEHDLPDGARHPYRAVAFGGS